jgi:hypothetical protein
LKGRKDRRGGKGRTKKDKGRPRRYFRLKESGETEWLKAMRDPRLGSGPNTSQQERILFIWAVDDTGIQTVD